jgi:hypothetical protein
LFILGLKAPAYTELLHQPTQLHFHSLRVSPQGDMKMNVHFVNAQCFLLLDDSIVGQLRWPSTLTTEYGQA